MNNWYQDIHNYIYSNFEYPELFIDILAATSPRNHIKKNWKLALRIYNTRHNPDLSGVMKPYKSNIYKALRGEPLSGRKITAFAANLKGDYSKVTIDIWTARYFGIYGYLSRKNFERITNIIKAMAKLSGVEPAIMQAELWIKSLRRHGRKPISYLSVIDYQLKLFKPESEVKMKILTLEQIRDAAEESELDALLYSIHHWEQLYALKPEEILDSACTPAANQCALCVRYRRNEIDSCGRCPLSEKDNCYRVNSPYKAALEAWNNVLRENGDYNAVRRWRYRAKKMIKVLKSCL